jgi:hypothetical protein
MKNERHQNLSLKILENGHHDGVLNNGIQTVDLRCQIPNNSICTHACENKLAGGRVRVLRGVFGRIYAGLYVQACKCKSTCLSFVQQSRASLFHTTRRSLYSRACKAVDAPREFSSLQIELPMFLITGMACIWAVRRSDSVLSLSKTHSISRKKST